MGNNVTRIYPIYTVYPRHHFSLQPFRVQMVAGKSWQYHFDGEGYQCDTFLKDPLSFLFIVGLEQTEAEVVRLQETTR